MKEVLMRVSKYSKTDRIKRLIELAVKGNYISVRPRGEIKKGE